MAGTEDANPTPGPCLYKARLRLHFLSCIDIGFLLDTSGDEGKALAEGLTEARSIGYVRDRLVKQVNGSCQLSVLAGGQEERVTVVDRMREASEKKGKAIWAESLLKDEAPTIFALRPELRSIQHNNIRFTPWEQPVARLFPRGVLAFEYDFEAELTPTGARTVEDVIDAVKKLRQDLRTRTWHDIRDKILRGTPNQAGHHHGLNVKWLSPESADSEQAVQQHLLHHTLMFLEEVPGDGGFDDDDVGDPGGIKAGSESAKAVAGLLNLTTWFSIYSQTYVNDVMCRAIRNRSDELYLTDNDASVIILKQFWNPEDPLRLYERDLILAVLFELSRATYLRYQAYYMRTTVLDRELRDDYAARSRSASLSSVLQMQRVLLRSSYEHPAERLIRHGFTRRFLDQFRHERGIDGAVNELQGYIDGVSRAVELGTGLQLEGSASRVARRTLWATAAAAVVAVVAIVITVLIA